VISDRYWSVACALVNIGRDLCVVNHRTGSIGRIRLLRIGMNRRLGQSSYVMILRWNVDGTCLTKRMLRRCHNGLVRLRLGGLCRGRGVLDCRLRDYLSFIWLSSLFRGALLPSPYDGNESWLMTNFQVEELSF